MEQCLLRREVAEIIRFRDVVRLPVLGPREKLYLSFFWSASFIFQGYQ